MYLVTNNIFYGRGILALTIVDNLSRQHLAICVGQLLEGEDVVAVMQYLHQQLSVVSEHIQVDNSSGFISKALDR
jgi:hypothetical protein